MNRAVQDLDAIYEYIAQTLLVPETALRQVDRIEEAILSLEELPHRCPQRRVGAYAKRGYRQLFVDNYTIVFRVDELHKMVLVVTVRYTPSQF